MINSNPVPLGKYLHYKEKEYELIAIATHSETQEEMAVYRALYGEQGLWVRPLEMFLETVSLPPAQGGQRIPRFRYIGDE